MTTERTGGASFLSPQESSESIVDFESKREADIDIVKEEYHEFIDGLAEIQTTARIAIGRAIPMPRQNTDDEEVLAGFIVPLPRRDSHTNHPQHLIFFKDDNSTVIKITAQNRSNIQESDPNLTYSPNLVPYPTDKKIKGIPELIENIFNDRSITVVSYASESDIKMLHTEVPLAMEHIKGTLAREQRLRALRCNSIRPGLSVVRELLPKKASRILKS